MKLRTAFASLGLAIAAGAAPAGAADTSWPQQTVRIVVPFPAGGAADFCARLIGQEIAQRSGQNIVVENRAGASGTIGAQTVVQSAADGYTLLFASPAEVLIGRIAGQKMSYDPHTDLEPVTLIGETPLAIVTNPATGITSVDTLLEQARKDPSRLSYGTPGTGSPQHFAGESFNLAGHTKILHVPYRGAVPVTADLMGNQIPLAILGMPPVVDQHKAGKLKILAVTTRKRSGTLPDIPAVAEFPGFSDYDFANWFGVYVPKGTPKPAIDQIAAMIGDILSQDAIRARLHEQGLEPAGNTPAEFARFLQGEKTKYEAVREKSGIKIE